MSSTKKCTRCYSRKATNQFYTKLGTKDNLDTVCIDCRKDERNFLPSSASTVLMKSRKMEDTNKITPWMNGHDEIYY